MATTRTELSIVFPTRVGMNRGNTKKTHLNFRIPHTRGDEPGKRGHGVRSDGVFPTRVGMNRWRPHTCAALGSIPHTRGDEPTFS